MAFLTLRYTDADISMSVSIYARVLDAVLARTGAELGSLNRPGDCINAGGGPPSVRGDLEAGGR